MAGQLFWSVGLMICWLVVAYGQYHQGKIVKQRRTCENVSIRLPFAVFVAQCILLIKGVYYNDWSLIAGCVIVNTGVCFNLYQIVKVRVAKRNG